jgi:glycerophosphoryl diester phosphodiesterase
MAERLNWRICYGSVCVNLKIAMQIIGHRGVRGEAPQNTLASFKMAIEAGLPAIELDVQLARSGEVIVFHDDDLTSVTRGRVRERLRDLDFKALRKINVHDGFSKQKFYQIPTLEEVLNLVNKLSGRGARVKVNIELKGLGTAGPVAKIVKRYLADGWQPNDFIISSFQHKELKKFRKILPSVHTAVLLRWYQWLLLGGNTGSVKFTTEIGAVAIHQNIRLVNRRLVDQAHHSGLKVNVYSAKTPAQYRKVAKLGVDGLFVDYLGLDA